MWKQDLFESADSYEPGARINPEASKQVLDGREARMRASTTRLTLSDDNLR